MDSQPSPPLPYSSPAPDLALKSKEPRVKFLWKWTLGFVLALVVWGMWQCGSTLRTGYRLAEPAVRQFHQQLDAGQYNEICDQAADGFCASGPEDKTVPFLTAVHEKLGKSGTAKEGQVNVHSGTDGTFLTVNFDTAYEAGSATETFTWIKTGGTIKLYRYNIQSNALILK